ncbi:hypothetical protein BDZ97DRAFT_1828397 [Flammula alnicola]|nr:hypothetical protein BDZ97DRAFT_1828397 [Flammula alnicola]
MILPPELIRSIIEQINCTSDLAVLSCASRNVQAEAERLLYRSMTSEDGTRSFKFLSSIQKHPHRAASVRVYHAHDIPHKQRRSIWNLITKSLRIMINLKELGFNNGILGTPRTIFPAHCPFLLEKFIWTCSRHNDHVLLGFDDGNPSYDEQALAFLEGQSQLRHLRWTTRGLNHPRKTPLCPNLRILEGNIHAFQIFLPGRSVTVLNWLEDSDSNFWDPNFWDPAIPVEDSLNSISPQLKMIRAFSFRHSWWGYIAAAFDHLQSLETLDILVLRYMDISFLLAKFGNLKTLIVSLKGNWDRYPLEAESTDNFVKEFFSLCSSLDRVYLATDPREDSRMYKVWINAVAQPALVDASEARSAFV